MRHPDCEAHPLGCVATDGNHAHCRPDHSGNCWELEKEVQAKEFRRETGIADATVPITDVYPGISADVQGVYRFHIAMLAKLAKKRAEGRSGWNLDAADGGVTIYALRNMLLEHFNKGDMVDIANFAMMIWNREHPHGE